VESTAANAICPAPVSRRTVAVSSVEAGAATSNRRDAFCNVVKCGVFVRPMAFRRSGESSSMAAMPR